MTTKKESRYYPYIDEHGKERYKKVTYTLVFDKNMLINVFNEYNFSIEKNSECWEFFVEKFKNN